MDHFVKPLYNYCSIKKNFDWISKRTLYFCTESYEIQFFSEEATKLISLSMQSYYQYFIALVSARSIILPSESHNWVNFCIKMQPYYQYFIAPVSARSIILPSESHIWLSQFLYLYYLSLSCLETCCFWRRFERCFSHLKKTTWFKTW